MDIVVASAGVGGNLQLIDAELRITASLKAGLENSKFFLQEEFSMYSEVSMLSGKLFLFAKVSVPKINLGLFKIGGWTLKEYHWDIWNWKGFTKKGYIFNINNKHFM